MTEVEDAQHAAQNVLISACAHPGFALEEGRGWRCRRCDGEVTVLLRPRQQASEPPAGCEFSAGCTEPEFSDWWERFGVHLTVDDRINTETLALAAFCAGKARAARRFAQDLPSTQQISAVGPSRAGAPHEEVSPVQAHALSHERLVPQSQMSDKHNTSVGPWRVPGLDLTSDEWREWTLVRSALAQGYACIAVGRSTLEKFDAELRRLRPASPAPEE